MAAQATTDWAATGAMLGGIGALVTAAIASVAALLALWQIRSSRETSALVAYAGFHDLCLQYPELATDVDVASLSSIEGNRYHWFVMRLLLTIESIMNLYPRDKAWAAAVTEDLACHRSYLSSADFDRHLPKLDRKLAALIMKTCRGGAH
jgi:hypothetical protein